MIENKYLFDISIDCLLFEIGYNNFEIYSFTLYPIFDSEIYL